MTTILTIDDVPEPVWDRLVVLAAARGQTVEDFVRAELTEFARRPEPDLASHPTDGATAGPDVPRPG